MNSDSPYMLLVAKVRKEKWKKNKAKENLFGIDKLNKAFGYTRVTHVDYSARVQTVHHETNPLYHSLISKFFDKTGCPIVVNWFNVRGEPLCVLHSTLLNVLWEQN